MSELYLMVTIMDRNKTKRFRALYESCGINVAYDTVGYGTAASEMLQYFGLEESEKAVARAKESGAKTVEEIIMKALQGGV